MTWTPWQVRRFAYGLVAIQLVQAGRFATDRFNKSYWVINYNHGFIRRGLGGALLQAVVGRPSHKELAAVTWAVSLLAVVALVFLLEMLLRRGTAQSYSLAMLLASSPFAFDFVLAQRRPDQLAVPVLVLLGVAMLRAGRGTLRACLAVGFAYGALTFIHEAVLIESLPFAVLLILVTQPRGSRTTACLLVAVPALAAGAVLALFGDVSVAVVEALRADSAYLSFGRVTEVRFLADNWRESLRQVWHMPLQARAASLALGTGLTIVQGVWLARWVRPRLAGRTAMIAAVAVGALAWLCAFGVDWVRWFGVIGCALVVVLAFAVLSRPRETRPGEGRVAVPRLLPAVALYLAVLAPLPWNIEPGAAVQLLLLKQ